MSEVNTETRVETVTANIEAVENMHGAEAYNQIMAVCLKDISLSLAMLVDAGTTNQSAES